jgi:uncharacterized protein YbjT (DUF2867 family)
LLLSKEFAMFVVSGATGNTGSIVANHLLAAGRRVRVVGRSADRLAPFVAQGAEAVVGDASDAVLMTAALTGATGAYFVVPPNPAAPDMLAYADSVITSYVTAARASRLPFAVLLSSLGADQLTGTGPIRTLHAAEARLANVTGLDVVALRAAYFMENQFGSLGMIRHMGINGGRIAAHLALPMIATKDIGAAAASALMADAPQGFTVRELLGSRDVTMAEVTRLIGAAVGKPELPYVQFSDADFIGGLVGAGFSPDLAALYCEMANGINSGHVANRSPRGPASTTPTSIEDFVPALAAAYAAG